MIKMSSTLEDYFQRFDDQITIFTALCVFFVPSLLRFKTTVQKEIENELGAIKRKKLTCHGE